MLSGGDHYALEVKGDSMIEAGILDGDMVIIRNANTASPGEIIVALVDDEEATLKRFRRKGASVALEAANPAYETRNLRPGSRSCAGKAGRTDPTVLREPTEHATRLVSIGCAITGLRAFRAAVSVWVTPVSSKDLYGRFVSAPK